MVKFAAKDTTYYWGDDSDAISDPRDRVLAKYDRAYPRHVDGD